MRTRLRFSLSECRTRAAGVVIVCSTLALTATNGSAQSKETGCCPQVSSEWLLFEDSNPRVPDFWRRDSVVVDVIDVCRHGINFYFFSEEDGQPRYVALIIVKPTRRLFETRVLRRVGDAPLEVRLERAHRKYAELLATLEQLFAVRFSGGVRIDFTNHPLGDRPLISPCRGLTLRWRGTEIQLRGYLDVYMTMVS